MNKLMFLSVVSLILPFSLAASAGQNISFLAGSAGVAAPSASTALSENPVGLLYGQGMAAAVSVHSSDNALKDPAFGGEIDFSRNEYGLGVGADYRSLPTGSTTLARYGLALHLSSLRFAAGFSGQTLVNPSGGSNYNAGVTFNPFGQFRLGFMGLGLSDGPHEWAGGFAYQSAPGVLLSSDFSTHRDADKINAQPGLLLGGTAAALSVSYGFVLSGGGSVASSLLNDGFSVGVGFKVGSRTNLNGYYKHIDKVYLQVAFDL